MRLRTMLDMLRSGRLGLLLATSRAMRASYRLAFLAAAVESGILARLARGPATLDDLGVAPAMRDGLEAWLGLGVWLGELRRTPDGWTLRSRLARRLADPAHDPAAAMVQEAGWLHPRWIFETPRRAREGRPFSLGDQDGALVARSSRVLEQIVGDAVDDVVPPDGTPRLFEIGCGTGIYMKRAADRNRALTAVGLELQADAAALARENVARWGLADRVAVEVGDVRQRPPRAEFELATLHNNIYYFAVAERVALLRHVRGFLRPGGRLLVTTVCLGPGVAVDILNVWGAMTEGCGRLPAPDELSDQLRAAGFTRVSRRSLIPNDSFYAFVADAP
jgi:4-hydroxy-2,2'-bipyrrole-5-carbaldehyde O-methyltransferase